MGLNLLDFCKFVNSFFLNQDTDRYMSNIWLWHCLSLFKFNHFSLHLFHCCWRNQVDNLCYKISHILDLAYFFPMISFYHDWYILVIRSRGLIRSGLRSSPSPLPPLPKNFLLHHIQEAHMRNVLCLSLWSYDWWGGLGIISLIHYKIPYRLFPQ